MSKEPVRKFYLKEFKSISHAMSTYGDLNLLLNHLVEGTTRTFEAKGCSIMLFDETENQLFTVSSFGPRLFICWQTPIGSGYGRTNI